LASRWVPGKGREGAIPELVKDQKGYNAEKRKKKCEKGNHYLKNK